MIFTEAQYYAVYSRLLPEYAPVPEKVVREIMEAAGRLMLTMIEGKANPEVYEQLADKARWR